MKKLTFLIFTFIALASIGQNDLRSIYNEGIAAYKEGDFDSFLKAMLAADSLSPNHPTITYNLAAAYAKSDKPTRSLENLTKAILMNAQLSPEEDEDFSDLDLTPILALKKSINEEVKTSTIGWTNPVKDLHPESIAYDPETNDFYLNSVRYGKILKYDSEEKTFTEFLTDRWAIMGMRVEGDYLWACEVATTELISFKEEDKGKTALLQIELRTGTVINRYELTGGHWFGDVIFNRAGEPLISDSMEPIVYTVRDGELVVYKDFSKELFNLQGLAFSTNESVLYIADYKLGLHQYSPGNDQVRLLSCPNDVITKGVDGLYFYENSLITIQNGVKPNRVSRMYLSESADAIERVDYLDKARPELNEPTLGVVVGDLFYYVANSPWPAYKDGELVTEDLGENLVLKVELK